MDTLSEDERDSILNYKGRVYDGFTLKESACIRILCNSIVDKVSRELFTFLKEEIGALEDERFVLLYNII